MLRQSEEHQLGAAAVDTLGLFERTKTQDEEELAHLKENIRQQKPLEAALHRSDVQHWLVIKEEVPHERKASLDQQDPESLYIKQEPEEVSTSQVEEQLLKGPEENINRITFTDVHLKNEDDDEEKPQLSQFHQNQTEVDGEFEPTTSVSSKRIKRESDAEDFCGPEQTWNPDPHTPGSASDSSLTEVSEDNEALPADVQQVLVIKEEVVHEWKGSLDQQDPEPPYVKQEPEEVSPTQNKQQLSGPEDHVNEIPFANVHLKSEDDEEKLQHSQSLQNQFEVNGDTTTNISFKLTKKEHKDFCGPEQVWNPDPHTLGKPSDSSLTEVSEDNEGWQEPLSDFVSGTGNGVHVREKPFSCDDCGQRFYEKITLKRHISIHTGEKPYSCNDCGKNFNRKTNLEAHMRVHTGEKPFICDHCGQKFNQKTTLKNHMRLHTGEKPFSCDHCGQRFNDKTNLNRHMRVHTGEKPFSCEECGQKFNQRAHLKRHIKVHTKETQFICHDCGKSFNRKTNLEAHMRVHTGEKPFSCDNCGQKFKQKIALKNHMRLHTGERPFRCDSCGQRFNRKAHLTTHMRVHTGEKPFSCDTCGLRFSHKTNFKTHMRVHTGEKPFSCDYCGQRFNQKINLKTHIRVHTGEKPFSCDYCGQRFNQKINVKAHMRVHTGEKPFSCQDCGLKFNHKTNLKKHMRVHT